MSRYYKYDVFISHAREDESFAQTLAAKLGDLEFVSCHKEANDGAGEENSKRMSKAVRDSATCLFLIGRAGSPPWTNGSLQSAIAARFKQARDEFRAVPVLLPDVNQNSLERLAATSGLDVIHQNLWRAVRFRKGIDEDDTLHELILRIRGVDLYEHSHWAYGWFKSYVHDRAKNALNVDWQYLFTEKSPSLWNECLHLSDIYFSPKELGTTGLTSGCTSKKNRQYFDLITFKELAHHPRRFIESLFLPTRQLDGVLGDSLEWLLIESAHAVAARSVTSLWQVELEHTRNALLNTLPWHSFWHSHEPRASQPDAKELALNQAPLLIVGSGGAGKSSLMLSLMRGLIENLSESGLPGRIKEPPALNDSTYRERDSWLWEWPNKASDDSIRRACHNCHVIPALYSCLHKRAGCLELEDLPFSFPTHETDRSLLQALNAITRLDRIENSVKKHASQVESDLARQFGRGMRSESDEETGAEPRWPDGVAQNCSNAVLHLWDFGPSPKEVPWRIRRNQQFTRISEKCSDLLWKRLDLIPGDGCNNSSVGMRFWPFDRKEGDFSQFNLDLPIIRRQDEDSHEIERLCRYFWGIGKEEWFELMMCLLMVSDEIEPGKGERAD